MLRLTFFIIIVLIYSCSQDNKDKSQKQIDSLQQAQSDTIINEYRLTAKFNLFDTTVEILFTNTKDSISDIQKKNYEGFLSKELLLTPEILNNIFAFYKSAYASYKKGWTMNGGISNKDLEQYLPTPTTAENLIPFITPVIVHIQNKQDCREGTIGIEFDCTWDIENGLGVLINNWKVVKVSTAEIVYF